jgi:hypothetical protein
VNSYVSYMRVSVDEYVDPPAEALLHQDLYRKLGENLRQKHGMRESNTKSCQFNELMRPQPGIFANYAPPSIAIVAVAATGKDGHSYTLLEPIEHIEHVHVTSVKDEVHLWAGRLDTEERLVDLRPQFAARFGYMSVRYQADPQKTVSQLPESRPGSPRGGIEGLITAR